MTHPTSEPRTLSPSAVALLNAIADLAPNSDPWAKYPAVLGVDEVAEILGIQPSAVSESARRGKLPMRKVLGKWKIDQLEFRRLVGYEPAAAAGGAAG